jgi:hypothetical protein
MISQWSKSLFSSQLYYLALFYIRLRPLCQKSPLQRLGAGIYDLPFVPTFFKVNYS